MIHKIGRKGKTIFATSKDLKMKDSIQGYDKRRTNFNKA